MLDIDHDAHADDITEQIKDYVENAVQTYGHERVDVVMEAQSGLNTAYQEIDHKIDDLEAEISRLRNLLGEIEDVDERDIHEMYTEAWDNLPDVHEEEARFVSGADDLDSVL